MFMSLMNRSSELNTSFCDHIYGLDFVVATKKWTKWPPTNTAKMVSHIHIIMRIGNITVNEERGNLDIL